MTRRERMPHVEVEDLREAIRWLFVHDPDGFRRVIPDAPDEIRFVVLDVVDEELDDPSRFSDDRGSSPRDPGPSSRPATVRRSFFRRALASLLDRVVPREAVELDGLDGSRIELDRARVRGEIPVEPAGIGFVPIVQEWTPEGERVIRSARFLSFGPALDGLGEISLADEDVPAVELRGISGIVEDLGGRVRSDGTVEIPRRDEPTLEEEERALGELDPYPRPPFVEGVFVGHDHASLRELDAGRRRILSATARLGFAPVVLGDGSCLRCGAVRFERSGWSVPAGFVFEGFAPGRPMCEPCALRVAVSFGDDVWLAEEFVVEPGPVEGRLRIRPTEIVVVPAGEVSARIEELRSGSRVCPNSGQTVTVGHAAPGVRFRCATCEFEGTFESDETGRAVVPSHEFGARR